MRESIKKFLLYALPIVVITIDKIVLWTDNQTPGNFVFFTILIIISLIPLIMYYELP